MKGGEWRCRGQSRGEDELIAHPADGMEHGSGRDGDLSEIDQWGNPFEEEYEDDVYDYYYHYYYYYYYYYYSYYCYYYH